MEKPHKIFYKKLIEGLKESPEHILLVDDDNKNIEGAKNAGLQTLLYDHSKNLTNEVLNAL
ncbi:hypothetical protein FACS189428_0520 [Clostridia bacterium]|nr:hypothetical protein FACS189428_0520 [Clostridia bacterium]